MSVSGRVRSRKVVAIDWDARMLRIVHAMVGKRGVAIDRVFSVAIPREIDPGDPEQMGRHIRRALEQEDIRTKHAIVDIPRDQAILNTLTLPAGAEEDLPGMVEIQVAKELPFSVSDAVIDFAVPPGEEGATTIDVLVAAVRREVLQQYEAIFAHAGLKLERIGLRPYANKVAVCDRLKHAMPERVAFIDVRPTLTEIDVLRSSSLAFSRAASVMIPEGLADGSALSIVADSPDAEPARPMVLPPGEGEPDAPVTTEEVIQTLLLEVTRSIEAYRAGDPGAHIDLAVIGGDVGVEEQLAEAIQKRLGITTEVYNPASSFGWEPDEGAAAAAFAATLGLVLAQADETTLHFDFLHPKRTESATQQRLKKAPAVAAVIVLFVAAGPIFLHGTTKHSRAELAEMNGRIEELDGNVRANQRFLKLVEEVRGFDRQYVWVDVLYDIMTALPSNEELVVKHVTLNQKDGKVVLKTQTKRRETPSEVIRALEEFRREGREKPRFKVTMPSQSEKAREQYPYAQDLRIEILADGSAETGMRIGSR